MSSSPTTNTSNNDDRSSSDESLSSPSFIFDSVKRNDFEQVKLFIQQNPSLLVVCDESNNTIIHLACKCNHEKIALFLLDRIATLTSTQTLIESIQKENDEKQSPISLANPKLRGMIKASIEISKMKKLLMEKYEKKRDASSTQSSSNAPQTNEQVHS